jgi:hypothetical protein
MLARQIDLEMQLDEPVAMAIFPGPTPPPRKPLLDIVKELLTRFGQVFTTSQKEPSSTSQDTK